MFPALYLYPLNDSFVPKHIHLPPAQRVKIGRQTNAKTVPAERNGYFDSKVLSRQHAEVWEEAHKIFIKDVKSSNGTFINGERLSPEAVESDPFELKTDDIVEFGIDIVGEDNKTVVHHKVAARVVCVFNEGDAGAAARAEASLASSPSSMHNGGTLSAGGGGGPSGFNFGGSTGPAGGARRPMQQTSLGGMGGMGGGMRPPGKSGLTFDHIISRLQGELQKSRETGAELHTLTGAMSEIHDTLGGSLPSALPPYPNNLPPVRPAPEPSSSSADAPITLPSMDSATLTELQSQLRETQSNLAGHVDKMRALETVFAEHDAIKREMTSLRDEIEHRRGASPGTSEHGGAPVDGLPGSTAMHGGLGLPGASEFESDEEASDDDDVRSVGTVMPHKLERVDEEDEDAAGAAGHEDAADDEDDEERRQRRAELGRPRTPEPMHFGMRYSKRSPTKFTTVPLDDAPPAGASAIPDELTSRLAALSSQLETALAMSRTLQEQHVEAQGTIHALQEKVAHLEGRVTVTETQAAAVSQAVETLQAAPPAGPAAPEGESLTQLVQDWKKNVEGRWSGVQEAWESERERLRRASDEWERRTREMEATVQSAVGRVDEGLERMEGLARAQSQAAARAASTHTGLVTPPSPRSLSADSARGARTRRRRASRSSSSGRGRRSAAGDLESDASAPGLTDTSSSDSASQPASLATSFTDSPRRAKTPWSALAAGFFPHPNPQLALDEDDEGGPRALARRFSDGAAVGAAADTPKPDSGALQAQPGADAPPKGMPPPPPAMQAIAPYSTAVGMLMLSVAAAAVMYRVKPDMSG